MRVAAHSDIGRNRPQNQDSYLVSLPIVAVADGMGGPAGGEIASGLAVEVLTKWKDTPDASASTLRDAVLQAHRAILERAGTDDGLEGMGTTLTAAWVDGAQVTLAHVGDSRAWLLRGGRLEQLTEDQTLVEQWVQEGKISREEAGPGHPYRSYLLQALGAQADINVETLGIELRPGDRLVLTSDGVHGQRGMSQSRIQEILSSTSDPQDACRTLVDSANEAGGDDNITVVLVEMEADESASTSQEPIATPSPVIVSRPSSGQHRTPSGGGRRRFPAWMLGAGAVVLVALIAGLFVVARPRPSIVVATSDGRVAILEGRAGDQSRPADGRVIETTDVEVSSLPVTFQRRVRTGIVVPSMEAARQTVRTLPRVLGPTQTPEPTPPPPEPAVQPPPPAVEEQ